MPKVPDDKQPRVKESGGFILNSYQTPNDYVDRFLHLLTGEECKVLTYTVRRIFGFHKRQDNISISQYQTGLDDGEGGKLDHGTGLSRGAIIAALKALVGFRLMVFVAPNDLQRNEGDCYGLQLDASKVAVEGLVARDTERREAGRRRTSAARLRSPKTAPDTHTPSVLPLSDPGKCDLPPPVSATDRQNDPEPVSPTDYPQSVPQAPGGLSDRHTITSRNPVEIQNTHTPPAAVASREKPVCVCRAPHASEFCGTVRLAYARNKPDSINNPDGWAYSKRAVAGEFDDAIRTWVEQGKPVGKEPPRDTSRCPDCEGLGMYEPGGKGKGYAKCLHARLPDVRQPGAQLPARASP